MDIKLNSLVETLFTNMAEGDVGEFASVVNTLSAAVTTITIELVLVSGRVMTF